MPNLNIPIDEDLLREVNLAAVRRDMHQKDFVLQVLREFVIYETTKPKDAVPVQNTMPLEESK
jgi:hypothetical protein